MESQLGDLPIYTRDLRGLRNDLEEFRKRTAIRVRSSLNRGAF